MTAPGFDAALAFARDLIRIPSLPGDEGALAKRVLEEMRALGLADIRTDPLGNVVGVVRGSGSGPSVLVNAHLDAVAVGDADEWEYPPFAAEVVGGHLHGRGAMDIKGPLALVTHAAASLAGRVEGDIIVAHTVFEERGGWGMEALLRDSGIEPAAALVVEATHGDIAIGHRGRAEVEVVLRGVAGHASAPGRAQNALARLPSVLEALDALAGAQPSDPTLGAATLVATQVDVRPESRNVIPDEVVVCVDWRILPGMEQQDLIRAIRRAIIERIGGDAEGSGSGETPPIEVRVARERQRTWTGVKEVRSLLTPGYLEDAESPIAMAAARAAGTRTDTAAPARIRPWTFATDGGWSSGVFGIPTVGFAPGEERFAHTNVERLDLDEARWAFERYPAVIMAIQDAAGRSNG